jgi:hypothetical protein
MPKNASSAIRFSLRHIADIQGEDDQDSYFFHHVTGSKMKEYFDQEGLAWNEYYKFTFVRNPFSRIVSQYFYALKCANDEEIKLCAPGYYKDCQRVQSGANSFKDFITKGDFHGMHEASQLKWLTEDFNFIGKVENLPDDYKHVCQEIGIPYRPLPKYNTTKHEHYTEYYDDETIDFVSNRYKESIERFNYKFGE